nr:PREDICTED: PLASMODESMATA CALLOSE-BINDING PROTEIN 2-like isoform X2 [Musa acuminata subsp. malaccensis]
MLADAAWCVWQAHVSTTALQKTMDYACGAGADCNPILQDGACYNPNTVLFDCSYGANSFHQRNGQAQTARDFSATAMLTCTDPSANGCLSCNSQEPQAHQQARAPHQAQQLPTLSAQQRATRRMDRYAFRAGTTSSRDGSNGGLLPMAGVVCLL